jgi:alkyl sulfatase BDS1-like metallo-beta-lactamase superfamily hydrolase
MATQNLRGKLAAAGDKLSEALPWLDIRDFEDVKRGLVGRLEPCVVKAADGRVVWDNDSYEFLAGEAPDTVNPSLWRQSKLVATDGLFEVVPGIYQVRGMDLSNITIVEGTTGVLVIGMNWSISNGSTVSARRRWT